MTTSIVWATLDIQVVLNGRVNLPNRKSNLFRLLTTEAETTETKILRKKTVAAFLAQLEMVVSISCISK